MSLSVLPVPAKLKIDSGVGPLLSYSNSQTITRPRPCVHLELAKKSLNIYIAKSCPRIEFVYGLIKVKLTEMEERRERSERGVERERDHFVASSVLEIRKGLDRADVVVLKR